MHELSVCMSLIAEAERVADLHGARAIGRIEVRIGPLSGVEPHQLARAFTIARAGTRAAEAELVCEPAPVVVACRQCGSESQASANALLCATCGTWKVELVSGDEMQLRRLELLDTEPQKDSKPCARIAAAP